MGEYVTLLGADDVHSAGNVMREAASSMRGVAESLDYSLRRHEDAMRILLDEHATRIENAMKGADDAE